MEAKHLQNFLNNPRISTIYTQIHYCEFKLPLWKYPVLKAADK